MLNKTRFPLLLLAGVLLALILAACSVPPPPAAPAAIGDRVVATYGAFDNLPTGESEALAQGWIDVDPGQCVPQMGRHFIKMAGEQPSPLVLLFNPAGRLIGVELESLSEQPAPPWEHLEQGHPGMEFEHWTVHFWFSDPAAACEA
ncbi:MAG: hypothetical protein D6775_03065 [Caldilineae bacterium]|nr:MAG: hypothetical protein D6775_03065 [Caldilineae bacterium]